MNFFNKKVLKNLYVFSNGSLLTNIRYKKQISNSLMVLLEKDFKSFEFLSKNKFSKKNVDLNASLNYRKNLFK